MNSLFYGDVSNLKITWLTVAYPGRATRTGCASGYSHSLKLLEARKQKIPDTTINAQLGVLSVHCPNGLYERSIWRNALEHLRTGQHTKLQALLLSGIILLQRSSRRSIPINVTWVKSNSSIRKRDLAS